MKELIAIQSKLEAPKGQFNKFGGYSYRSAEDILKAVKPLADEQKSSITLSDEVVMVGDRIYIKSTATITNEKGEAFSTTGYAREAESKKGMDESQISGSASSYARKYALNGLLAIDDTKDADSNEQHEQTKATNNSKPTGNKPKDPLNSEFGKLSKQIQTNRNIDETTFFQGLSGSVGLNLKQFTDFAKLSQTQKQMIVETLRGWVGDK